MSIQHTALVNSGLSEDEATFLLDIKNSLTLEEAKSIQKSRESKVDLNSQSAESPKIKALDETISIIDEKSKMLEITIEKIGTIKAVIAGETLLPYEDLLSEVDRLSLDEILNSNILEALDETSKTLSRTLASLEAQKKRFNDSTHKIQSLFDNSLEVATNKVDKATSIDETPDLKL